MPRPARRRPPRSREAAVDAALAAGKPVLIDVSAPRCPTCKARKPILSGFRLLTADFDSQPVAPKVLHARQQRTPIVYKGGQEVGRSTGDTDAASIAAPVGKAL